MLNTPLSHLWPRARAQPLARQATAPYHEPLVIGTSSGLGQQVSTLRGKQVQIGDRRSLDETPAGTLARLAGDYVGYPTDSRTRISGVLRMLLQNDEDVSGTASDYLAIVNPGHTVEFVGSRKAVKAARAELDAFARTIFPEGGGLDGLANNQVLELLASPASSLEWICDVRRSGVIGVAVVPAERVTLGRDPETGERTYHQVGLAVDPIRLDPITYLYAPLITQGGNPHGVPMFLAALKAIDRKNRLTADIDRVIDLMRQIALVGVELPMPTPQEFGLQDPFDPRYQEYKNQYANEAADMILELAPKGLFVGPQGTKFTINNISHSLAGLPEIEEGNNRRVWSGLHTTSFLRGHMKNTTEALAKIVYPMLEARATNLQQVIARQLEFGLNLHLRLRGINAVAYVKFQQAESAFKQAEADAYLTRMQAHEIGKRVAGKAYARRFADDLDFSDDEDLHAPTWAEGWDAASAAPASSAGNGQTSPPEAARTRLLAHYDRRAGRYVHPLDLRLEAQGD